MCDLTVTRDDRDAWLGKAAIAQNAVFRNNSIPEFDFALPLVALTQPSGATHEEKVNGQRKYFLTSKSTAYAPRHPKGGRDTRKLGQHRVLLRKLQDPDNGVVVVPRCEDRERHLFGPDMDCDAWNREAGGYNHSGLMNTTFALVPGGRIPGTCRLLETVLSGALPVFVDQFSEG